MFGTIHAKLKAWQNRLGERFGTDIKQGVILMAAAKGFPLEFIVDVESKFAELRERAAQFWAQVLQKV